MMSLKSNSKEVALREVVHSYLQDFLFREDEIAWSHQQGLRTKRWTYSHIAQVALQFVQYLAANGIKKGDRVIFWGANSPQWVAGFWGCLAAGVVVVPIDWQSREDFVAKVDAQVDAKLLLIDKERSDKVRELQLEVVFFEDLKEKVGAYDYKQTEMASVEGKDLAEIIFTSGTTAEPKGVCLSHKNILANLAPLEEEIRKYTLLKKLFHPIRFLNLLPFSHVFGQFMGIFIPQLLSGEVFLFNSVHPVEVMELIRREKISVMVAVPRLLETLREKVERDWIDKYGQSIEQELEKAEGKHFIKNWWRFRSIHSQFGWKFWGFVSGGATLASETELFWRRLGFAVIQGYGMTETASLVSVVHPFKMSRGSIGKSLPGREIKIDGNGEILVRGENISVGVWRSGVTKITDEEGWLRTGDIAERDSDGNLFFKGRKKEVIVTSAGMNVYPQDLESALNRQPEVKTSAVVGIEGQRGTEPVAFLILKPGSYDAASIIARANELLSEYQKIRKWYIWPEEDFPRTSTQKVKKTDLIAAMSGDEPVRATSEFLISKIAQLSGSNLEYDPMSKITTDLKLDSLGKVELISALEDYYQVEVEDSLFTESMTLAEIETIIKEKLGKKAVSFRHSGLVSQSGDSEELFEAAVSKYPYPVWATRFPVTWLRLILLYVLILPITLVLSRLTVRGRQYLEKADESLIFVSNHISFVDHALILAALPKRFRHKLAIVMDGERLRSYRYPSLTLGLLTRLRLRLQYLLIVLLFNVFALPKKSSFRRSFGYAAMLVDKGYSLLIFPEGLRTKDGSMAKFQSGVGILAKELNLAVAPVRIDGLFDLRSRRKKWSRFWAYSGEIKLTFGQVVRFSCEQVKDIAVHLEHIVRELGE